MFFGFFVRNAGPTIGRLLSQIVALRIMFSYRGRPV
jgi:hypothetical protein